MSRFPHGHMENSHVNHAAHEIMVSESKVKKHDFLSTIKTGLTKESRDFLVEKGDNTGFDTAHTNPPAVTQNMYAVNSSWLRGFSTRKDDRDKEATTSSTPNIEDDLAKATSKWDFLLLNEQEEEVLIKKM